MNRSQYLYTLTSDRTCATERRLSFASALLCMSPMVSPAFGATINAVSARLSTQALRLMNAAVSLDQQSPAGVARQFLGANGLA